mmetsp:Transcript_2/g.5  ORF Transcript_2/g.5 Transcript_2/m.5 type:complete len:105 (-) Transcript_2:1057-1371(-)
MVQHLNTPVCELIVSHLTKKTQEVRISLPKDLSQSETVFAFSIAKATLPRFRLEAEESFVTHSTPSNGRKLEKIPTAAKHDSTKRLLTVPHLASHKFQFIKECL